MVSKTIILTLLFLSSENVHRRIDVPRYLTLQCCVHDFSHELCRRVSDDRVLMMMVADSALLRILILRKHTFGEVQVSLGKEITQSLTLLS